jgi:hypothetical protein
MSDAGKDPTMGRNPAGELLAFALDHEVARAKGEPQWASHDRFAMSLAKHRDLTVNVMLLRKGAHLQEHQARGSITLQVLSGAFASSPTARREPSPPGCSPCSTRKFRTACRLSMKARFC